ncbi:VacJ family lipoprotein [Pseudomonas chlororaphis]|uniref:MlaA family lipoprotein n=1 Tax=Pseudomonas chlororaphis TaxID=587753 RepID=UPI000E0C3B87|nr:VacJ family lipoprotein [Pseudomonas chlororaphis]AZD14645.1 Outer-membrane-phospholipid-binding lipoprotein MlaA [Pseudomonas chlororaphis]ROL75105.1 ABC transporter [Pseudomonas chlororaphis]WDH24626.1 VacJ family lipoprotein [Pseudomonas chlororaphis]WDH49105.1 VacJ family lipoprotein [Pseudomonas chlororaphis]WDH60955.1 VacJ family lipoprotein [Pseudomonas chlororaphis]
MAKHLLLIAALFCAGYANADDGQTATPVVADGDGFTQPLKQLKFNPGLDQREFERSTLNALNVYDPLESWNRRVYHFNYRFDQWVFLPVVDGYRYITPSFLRTGVSNFFNNLGDVPNLVNSLLQFKGQRSLNTTARLLVNTTLGIGGLWDPATRMGLPRQSEDFGQTLGFYGVPGGAYFVLPILGPSNLRDTAGLAVDYTTESAINFLNVSEVSSNHPELWVLRAIDKRYQTSFRYGQLDSPFEYEKVRYVYTESRKLQIAE